MTRKLLVIPFLTLFVFGLVWGQRGGQERGRERSRRPSQPQLEESTRERRQPRPIFITGQVLLEDGSRPQQLVTVELVCYGAVRRQVQAFRGQFSLDFGTNRPVGMMDASVGGLPSDDEFFRGGGRSVGGPASVGMDNPRADTLDLSGCELRAALPGFQSDTIHLGRRRPLDNPDVGSMVLHRLGDVQGTAISLSSLRAPKKAKKAYEKAEKEFRKKKSNHKKVAKELQKAIKEYPEFASAWHLLGEVRLVLKDSDGAQQAFERAMTHDPKFISPYLSLARMEFENDRWEDVARLTDGVIELNPHVTYAYYLNAAANYSMGKLDRAEESARKVTGSEDIRRFPQARFIVGGVLAQKGNVSSASAEFNQYLELESEGPLADRVKAILNEWQQQGLIEATSAPEK